MKYGCTHSNTYVMNQVELQLSKGLFGITQKSSYICYVAPLDSPHMCSGEWMQPYYIRRNIIRIISRWFTDQRYKIAWAKLKAVISWRNSEWRQKRWRQTLAKEHINRFDRVDAKAREREKIFCLFIQTRHCMAMWLFLYDCAGLKQIQILDRVDGAGGGGRGGCWCGWMVGDGGKSNYLSLHTELCNEVKCANNAIKCSLSLRIQKKRVFLGE